MGEATKPLTEIDGLEIEIMDARRRIDTKVEELSRRARRAVDVRRYLTDYGSAFVAAAFAFGFIIGVGSRRRRTGRKAEKKSASSAVLLKMVTPVITELLLQQVRKPMNCERH